MNLILVRHGETRLNRDRRIQGINRLPLTALGREQAHATAMALAEDQPFLLYSSPVVRAMETAAIISRTLDVPVKAEDGLKELDAGELEGLTGQEMRQRYPDFSAAWDSDASTAKMPGGESLAQVQLRAWAAVQDLAQRHPEDTVVAVSHNFTIQAIICTVFDMPLHNARRLRLNVGSITRLEFSGGDPMLVSHNETWQMESAQSREDG